MFYFTCDRSFTHTAFRSSRPTCFKSDGVLCLKPNTHRRRDAAIESSQSGVYWALDCHYQHYTKPTQNTILCGVLRLQGGAQSHRNLHWNVMNSQFIVVRRSPQWRWIVLASKYECFRDVFFQVYWSRSEVLWRVPTIRRIFRKQPVVVINLIALLKKKQHYLRNRRWSGCVCFTEMFFSVSFFFLFFFRPSKKYQTTVLGNGWTDFHETFTKR